MPTYQYACTACGEQTEAVQSFTDAALTDCPACDGRLRKVYSAVGVVFKGSGFYKNDSRKPESDGKPAEKKADAVAASSSNGSTASSDKCSSSSSDKSSSSPKPSDKASSGSTSSGSTSSGSTSSGSKGSSGNPPATSTPAAKSA